MKELFENINMDDILYLSDYTIILKIINANMINNIQNDY